VTRTGRPRSTTDEEIFHGLIEVVGRVGPSALTLAAVAERVGLSAPALTQRFGSKRGLLVAFAEHAAGAAGDSFAAARADGLDPLGALHAAFAALVRPIPTREVLANHLAFLQLDLTDPQLRTHAVAQSRELRSNIAALLEAAVAAGDLRQVDPRTLADALYITYNGALVAWAIDGRGPLDEWLRHHMDQALAPFRVTP
jgi:AcrR family transcriptional regulator